jgi:hypothetical protein
MNSRIAFGILLMMNIVSVMYSLRGRSMLSRSVICCGLRAVTSTASTHRHKFVSLQDKIFSQWRMLEISPQSTILLSVSGGSDSVAMLHLLQSIKHMYLPDLDLKVVNFNHKKRQESDEEVRRY